MSRPVRVLHCLSSITSGGVERRHLEIVRHLPSPGFLHRFIGTEADGPIADALQREGAEITTLGPVRSVLLPGRYRRGVAVARAWHPDLIHGAVMEGTVMATVVGRRLGIPVVTEETSDPQNRRPMGHRLAKLVAQSATRCVAVSPAVGRYLTEELGVPSDKVSVVVNGVSEPKPLPPTEATELRAALGIGADDVVIGTVCRLFDDHKRVTDLIEAFSTLAMKFPKSHLLIVGSGPDRSLMKDAARKTGNATRIHFVERRIPADPYYAIMDVFALASSREAFGLVAAEAMRAGLPVVATRVGGLAEIVDDGVTGHLVTPLVPAQLARALEGLVSDKATRDRMGEAGRRKAEREYSVERYAQDVERLYVDVLSARR